jgi:hypothetical protein
MFGLGGESGEWVRAHSSDLFGLLSRKWGLTMPNVIWTGVIPKRLVTPVYRKSARLTISGDDGRRAHLVPEKPREGTNLILQRAGLFQSAHRWSDGAISFTYKSVLPRSRSRDRTYHFSSKKPRSRTPFHFTRVYPHCDARRSLRNPSRTKHAHSVRVSDGVSEKRSCDHMYRFGPEAFMDQENGRIVVQTH